MLILNRPLVTYTALFGAVSSGVLGPTHQRFFAEMLPALWDEATAYAVCPVGVVAQSYHETAGGRFTGKVRPEFRNTCGLKLREDQREFHPETFGDMPLAHAQFASWWIGARAHVQHLRAYAGSPVPIDEVVDPRYDLIGPPYCEHFADLNGRWAGRAGNTYGDTIERLMGQLMAATEETR